MDAHSADPPLADAGTTESLLDDWLASPGAGPADLAEVVTETPVAEPAPDPALPAPAGPSLFETLATDSSDGSSDDQSSQTDAAPSAAAARSFVLFTVGGSSYAVRETFVSEVTRVPKITLVPHVPAWVRGVTNLSGDIVSVVDLRALLGLEPTAAHTGRLLVVRLPDEEFSLALLVDGVDQIAKVPIESVRPPASPLQGPLAAFLTAVCHVGGRLVTVIDLDQLLRSAEIRRFEMRSEAGAGV